MSENTVIAATATGPPGWLQRFTDSDWPVRREDLDSEIRRIADERAMRVLSVGDAIQRGPIPIHGVDEHGRMTDETIAETAQLYAYVEWESI